MPLADLKTGFSLEVFSVEFKNECVTARLSSSLHVSVFPSPQPLLITVNAARKHCVKSSAPCQKSFVHLPVVSLRRWTTESNLTDGAFLESMGLFHVSILERAGRKLDRGFHHGQSRPIRFLMVFVPVGNS